MISDERTGKSFAPDLHAKQRILKIGQLSMIYENGSIRSIKAGEIEIVRMIYSAVRDQNWRTIEPFLIRDKIKENTSGFKIEVSAKYKGNGILFYADYIITGTPGRLVFEMKGEARSSFVTNRIGFCVLHPIKECAGKNCTVYHPDETTETLVFPELIAPVQPVKNISAMVWEPVRGISAKLHFSGDIFEMEDQRNWTDASYKTYCRPLDLPFPFEMKKGENVKQEIILDITGKSQNDTAVSEFSFSYDKNRIFKIPELGTGMTSREEPLENEEAELLRKLPFKHLHAEIKLFEKNWEAQLERAIAESDMMELHLFLVLYFSERFEDEIIKLSRYLLNKEIIAKYILVVDKNHLSNDLIIEAVYPELKKIFTGAKIGAGVNANFAELNRNRPQLQNAGFISFSICPQVHASDNFSLVENLEAQKDVVESARHIFPKIPVFVSPVTLKQRFNIVATSSEPELTPDNLPLQVDPRQSSQFAAYWLLGSIKYLTQAGAKLVTYFESVGWRGFIQGNYEPPVAEKFLAEKGSVFPVFKVMKKLKGFSELVYSYSSHPLLFDGLVVKSENRTRIFLFSFSDVDIEIQINQSDDNDESKSVMSETKVESKKRIVLLKSFGLLQIFD